MTTPLLEVHQLRLATRHNGKIVYPVEDISFTLHPGKTLALIGESGGGKSLTCLALMGLLPAEVSLVRGSMRLNAYAAQGLQPTMPLAMQSAATASWLNLPCPELCGGGMALIMQNPASCFDPLFTIRHAFVETLRDHGLRITRQTDAHIIQLLQEVGLRAPQRLLPLYPFQLSGGMLQRVMIALALALNPFLLLADEPLSSLDTPGQNAIMALLRQLQEVRGFAMLFVSHDIGAASALAHDMLVLRQGRVVECAPTTKLLAEPQSLYTQQLLYAHESLNDSLKHLPGLAPASDACRPKETPYA